MEPFPNAYRRYNYGPASRYDDEGYRRSDGRKKIMGYSQSQGPARTFGGLNEYYALQDRNTRAFADPRFPGKSGAEISQNAQSMGQQINRYGQAEDAYSNRFRANAPQRGASREENVAAAKRDGSFARLRKEYNRASTDKKMDRDGNIVEVPKQTGAAARDAAAGAVGGPVAAAASRAARSAKEYHPEKRLEGKVPTENHASPLEERTPKPPIEGRPATLADHARVAAASRGSPPAPKTEEEAPTETQSSPRASTVVTSAQRREMLRDAAAGRSDTMKDGRITRIDSKYGTAEAGVPVNDPNRVGMVRDDFGNMVPIKSFSDRRRYVESTQKGYNPSRRV